MKNALAWVKSHLLIVIAGVAVLIGMPVMIYFSMQWNASIREEAETSFKQQLRDVEGITVTYEIPSVIPGQPEVSVQATPNPATTEAVAEMLKQINEESAQVRREAVERNCAGKRLIISGYDPSMDLAVWNPETNSFEQPPVVDEEQVLFPEPSDRSSTRLRQEMNEVWPRRHTDLLREHKAGSPPEPGAVLRELNRFRAREIERLTADRVDQTLTPTETAALTEELSERRLSLYRSQASNLSFYAEPDVFVGVEPWPTGELPDLATLWEWQWIYWVHEDVIKAVARANEDEAGLWLRVYEAPVKRLESIEVEPLEAAAGGGRADAPEAGALDDSQLVEPDYSLTFTGRSSWPNRANPFYDVRYVNMTCIASSARLPVLMDAINDTNFMTVIDYDVEATDSLAALEQGYDYGAEHVVRASMRIETIWLRHWMLPYMPDSVRAEMGIPPRETEEAEEGEAP